MASTSTVVSSGGWMFRNRQCKCGKKAAVGISESTNNPGKLYFRCAEGQCNFFAWWTGHLTNEVKRGNEVDEWSTVEGRNEDIEISTRLRNLEANQAAVKLILIGSVLFTWLTVLIILVALLVKGYSVQCWKVVLVGRGFCKWAIVFYVFVALSVGKSSEC